MKCPSKIRGGDARLLAFAAGQINGDEMIGMAAHVRGCEACLNFVVAQAEVWNLLDGWEPSPVSQNFDRRLYARIEREPTGFVWSRLSDIVSGWVARPALPLAALTILLIAGVYVDRPGASRVVPPGTVAASPIESAGFGVTPSSVSATDAEQLKRAFDDLQLLHLLDSAKDEAGDASHAM